MICNIIGHGEGFEYGYEAEGFRLGINYFHPSLSALMEMHPEWHEYSKKLSRERDNALACDMELITQQTMPIQTLMDMFGTDFFDSSGDLAIAWAILRGATKIRLFGMTYDDVGDHWERRAATNYWIGYARGKGVNVDIVGNSTLCTTISGLSYGTFQPMKRQFKQI